MAILSGSTGTLFIGPGEVTPLANWKLAITSSNAAYVANDSNGWPRRVAGVKDCGGSFEVKLQDDGHCPVDAGDTIGLQLHVDGSSDNYYEVPAIVDRVRVDLDLTHRRVVGHVVEFSANGPTIAHGALANAGA